MSVPKIILDLTAALEAAAEAAVHDPATQAAFEQLLLDVLGKSRVTVTAGGGKVENLFNALPVLDRLRLTARDKSEIAAWSATSTAALAQGADLADAAIAAGKINWCALAASAAAIIAQLEASGIAIPPYIGLVFSVLSALCPVPSSGS